MAETPSKPPAKQESTHWHPLSSLRREIDRLFDDFPFNPWRRSASGLFDVEPFGRGLSFATAPAIDIIERDKEYEVTAELPGMEEKDIDVRFADGVLTITGEKQEEKEEREKNYYLSERQYGSFQRALRVPNGVDADKIDASFKNGVLTVILQKSAEAQKREKKIEIKKG